MRVTSLASTADRARLCFPRGIVPVAFSDKRMGDFV
jgi:hypothetical protein